MNKALQRPIRNTKVGVAIQRHGTGGEGWKPVEELYLTINPLAPIKQWVYINPSLFEEGKTIAWRGDCLDTPSEGDWEWERGFEHLQQVI